MIHQSAESTLLLISRLVVNRCGIQYVHYSLSMCQIDGSLVFSDLKSKFGSKVNNTAVTTAVQVHDNDVLVIGQGPTKLRYTTLHMENYSMYN